MIENILHDIARLSEALVYDGLWGTLGNSRNVRRLPADTGPLVQALTAAYDPSRLEELGLVERPEQGEVQAAGILAQGGTLLRTLRRAKDQQPFDMLLPEGTLRGAPLAAAACIKDHEIAQRASTAKRLFLVGTIEDLAVLDDLGLPVAPAWDLTVKPTSLPALVKQLRRPEPAPTFRRLGEVSGALAFRPCRPRRPNCLLITAETPMPPGGGPADR